MSKLWVVTGAAGFLGSVVVRKLVESGETVRACDIGPDPGPALAGVDCEYVQIDVTRKETLAGVFTSTQPVTVVHCAGVVSIASKVSHRVYQVNVLGTCNVLSACREQKIRRLVHVSSIHAIPEPKADKVIREVDDPAGFSAELVTGEYAKTKAEATRQVLLADDLDKVIVHPSGLIGPGDFGDSHTTRMISDLLNGKLPIVVNGGNDFVDVRDVADGIILAENQGESGRCYILSGYHVSIAEIARMVYSIAEINRKVHTMPIAIAKWISSLAEWYYKMRGVAPLYTAYSLYALTAPSNYSNQRAKTELGFTPRPIRQTLSETIDWLQARQKV